MATMQVKQAVMGSVPGRLRPKIGPVVGGVRGLTGTVRDER
jgi:hypothetical protein